MGMFHYKHKESFTNQERTYLQEIIKDIYFDGLSEKHVSVKSEGIEFLHGRVSRKPPLNQKNFNKNLTTIIDQKLIFQHILLEFSFAVKSKINVDKRSRIKID